LLPGQEAITRPLIPLADGTLLINAPSEPSVGLALQAEVPSADRIDLLCAFIKWSGLRLLQPVLAQHLAAGRPLRVLTTVYLGATDRRALDWLVEHKAQVRVSTDTRRTRLHAKAWLFHRASGSSTAYIGSSNLSAPALLDGLEWNVRLAALETPAMLRKFEGTFEAYWEEGEFEPYAATPEQRDRLDHQLSLARGVDQAATSSSGAITTPVWFTLRPYAYQREMLDALAAERSLHQRWRNLVVAATGTGKTVLAAFDVARLHADFPEQFPSPEPPPLLLIAHRKEILLQALATFRQVLRDPSFGELYVDGEMPSQWRHVFASVQSLANRSLAEIPAERFKVVIVDEFHHAAASSYRRWIDHLRPQLLLGLTATPERADGLDILHWFGGRIASELRLWSALDQGLLAPFHYFAVADATDLSALEWRRGGYVPSQLSAVYTGDHRRVDLILSELHDKLADPVRMRALGFCVSVEHARFMAERFRAAGFAAEALDASTPADLRHEALRRLQAGELQILFAVDLFNEGLDIPSIDTVLLLRPTESAVVFLQQLGRGLRLSPDTGKSCLTVLDFIGQQHRRFRFDLRYRALLGCSRRQLEDQLAQGFPFLPPGCRLVLDRISSERVLANLRQCLPSRRPQLLQELRSLAAEGRIGPASGLADWLDAIAMEPADFYGIRGAGCTPSPGGAPQPRHRRRPAPPRRPRPSARHRRLPGRLSAARSAGPLRAREAPVADAHRPAVWHRPPMAAPRSGPGGALAGRRLARGADSAAAAVGRACEPPTCCSSPCAKAKPSSPPPPATATWPSAPPCSTGKARAPPPRPRPPASATSTTPRAPPGRCCLYASSANRTAAPAPPPNRLCVWGLRPTKATKANARWRGGISVAAAAGDPGGVAAGDGVGGLALSHGSPRADHHQSGCAFRQALRSRHPAHRGGCSWLSGQWHE
jgi:superfamily II DNA or RNA helicase/HKD family nuclease